MKVWKLLIILLTVLSLSFAAGYHKNHEQVQDLRAISQSWRQTAKKWKGEMLGWRGTAEHYGGMCKWLLENKPRTGPAIKGPNCVLTDCLFIYEGDMEISGEGTMIIGGEFRAWNMDWVNSLDAVNPNDTQE